ncbi:hypothetical protein SAMN05660776_1758 [Salegentibacter holothuriorum]|uniref:Lipoprotein n=1 Tax=Salegentibacter holothuriorum TaxID=241145 RepID=A0A1T5C369_9FLAO|nr:hypothetical protein [Salegentibacter holothuriorum]SKB53789.1 hypothetical protein SAMN05660776_1758 [Salegentibacter holothuriorum]
MKRISLIIAILSLVACGSSNKNTSSKDKFVVENLTNYNADDLMNDYPEANFYEDSGMFEEGTVERAYTVMYPETPDELHITWKSNERKEIFDIRFSEKGKWKSAKGIEIGTSYEALNELNGEKISFYGFGWDYGGAVMWNDGKLENSNLRVFLAPENEVDNKFYKDRIIEVSEEEIKDMDLKVTSIMLVN